MNYKVFLLEDDDELRDILSSYLRRENYDICSFSTGIQAISAIQNKPHLWILDIMLPDTDGYEVIKKIKAKTPSVPVIFISARDQTLDRVLGLEMGSDDYIAKPFLPRELVIRVKKLLERTYGTTETPGKTYIINNYEVDEEKRTVTEEGSEIFLTSKEMDLLLTFVRNTGRPFSRDSLLTLIWGDDYFGSERVVDDLIRRLRKKLPDLHIETVYGQGYRLVI
ncbi:MAG: DNA-binding response regulator [Clostridiales bacterium 43-6]|nr:MAG: DNA-binding response regulator [Clostridiales bacterium 43-6]